VLADCRHWTSALCNWESLLLRNVRCKHDRRSSPGKATTATHCVFSSFGFKSFFTFNIAVSLRPLWVDEVTAAFQRSCSMRRPANDTQRVAFSARYVAHVVNHLPLAAIVRLLGVMPSPQPFIVGCHCLHGP